MKQIKKIANVGAIVAKVIDNFLSTSGIDALSANKGKELNDRFTYSTTEQIIGKWTDGKTLYRKCYNASVTKSSTSVIASGVTNIDKIINIYGTFNGSSFGLPVNFYNGSICFAHYSRGTNVFNVSNNYESGTVDLIVEYTKTV